MARVRASVGRGPIVVGLRITGLLSLPLIGGSASLRALARLDDGSETDVTDKTHWSTTNGSVVSISAGGLLQATGPGICDVVALHAGVSARAEARVVLDLPGIVKLTIAGATDLLLGQTTQLRAIAHLSDGTTQDVTDKTTWNTTSPLISVVGQAGLLTGLGLGTCDVVAVHAGLSAKVTVLVRVLE